MLAFRQSGFAPTNSCHWKRQRLNRLDGNLTFATQSIKRKQTKQVFSDVSLSHNRHQSLLLRPIRALRVSGGDLEPSANSPDKLGRSRHIQSRRRRGRLGTRLAAPRTAPHLHVKLTPPFIRDKKKLYNAMFRRMSLGVQ